MLRSFLCNRWTFRRSATRKIVCRKSSVENLERRLLLAQIDYSTFLGGNRSDRVTSIVAVEGGCTFVAGNTLSSSMYGSPNAGFSDVFVAKLKTDSDSSCDEQVIVLGGPEGPRRSGRVDLDGPRSGR